MIETAELLLDGVEVEERLRRMVARAVPRADDRHRRDPRRPVDRSGLGMTQHDGVGVAADDPNRVLE